MATLRPFVALRPPRDLVGAVAAPPYDVVDSAEAAALAEGNPDSFLRVSKPEIGLPAGAAPGDVHAFGRSVLEELLRRGTLRRDGAPGLFVYRQGMEPSAAGPSETAESGTAGPADAAGTAGSSDAAGPTGPAAQTGLVGAVTVADYRSGAIAIHEHTRPDKETDRTEHIAALSAHDEPVFLMYRREAPGAAAIARVLARVTAAEPEYDLVRDGVRHTLWTVPGPDVDALVAGVAEVPVLYVADGHHRSAAAARLAAADRRPGAGEFPAVLFPADELTVLAYNRVVRDLGVHTPGSFLELLASDFVVRPADAAPRLARHEFGVYLAGQWWTAAARSVDESDPIGRLDVSVLQDRVLGPLLGIADPRTDERIAFVGGVRGTAELVRLVDEGRAAVAFALHPTATADVMDVADSGQVMPPKSTWFEPKLLSGLFVHPID